MERILREGEHVLYKSPQLPFVDFYITLKKVHVASIDIVINANELRIANRNINMNEGYSIEGLATVSLVKIEGQEATIRIQDTIVRNTVEKDKHGHVIRNGSIGKDIL